MEYVLAGITAISAIPSHLESMWNVMDSMWIPSFHMESTWKKEITKKGDL